VVRKAKKSYGARSELNSVFGLEKVNRWNPIRPFIIGKMEEKCGKVEKMHHTMYSQRLRMHGSLLSCSFYACMYVCMGSG
jgi:hypothetical protein